MNWKQLLKGQTIDLNRKKKIKRTYNGTTLQYSCLENPMDRGAWKAAVHGVTEGRTRLRDFTFTFHFHALEKEMATHSSVLAWRIPGMGEPGGLLSTGSHRVGHYWSDLAAAVFQLTYPFFCLRYFAIDFFSSIFNFRNCAVFHHLFILYFF